MTNLKCSNAEPGTYGHECGKPATWTAKHKRTLAARAYCDGCKRTGTEAAQCNEWSPA